MPIHPSGINRVNFLSHAAVDNGIAHSVNLRGGFQEVYSIAERNAIPLMANNIGAEYDGFTQSDDVLSSGKRRVGMFVHVLEERKIYTLIPVGFFNNGGSLGETEWAGLPEWERAVRINPSESYSSGPAVPIDNTYTVFESPQSGAGDLVPAIAADANSCWVEVEFGGDNIYSSNLAGTLSMTEDVGGMPSGTLVSDLTEIKTYDQLFDTILFPTSYPTASGPSVGLSGASGLKIIGSTFAGTLTTTANQGSITLNGVNQGVRSGDVTAANIAGPGGPYTLGVTAPNGIDDQAIAGHTVTEGSNSWTLTATFAQGPMPLDSTGADYPSVRYNGGDKTNSASFEGVYPIFLGNVGGNFDQASLISHGANYPNIQTDQAYAEVNGSLHHRISIPDDMIDGRTIEVWQYSTVSTQYAEATAAWVVSSETRTIESNTVNYTLLSKTGSAGGSNLYRIKFV
jgi:hypothetical protein